MNNGFYEVKVFDGQGNLKKVISAEKLHSIYWNKDNQDRLAKHRRYPNYPNPDKKGSKNKIKF